jgi:DNA uptake protein ComE-like DNA-binding protein
MPQPTPPDNWTHRAIMAQPTLDTPPGGDPAGAPWSGAPRAAQADPTPQPARRSLAVRIASRWYYVVVVATAGFFAWIPFLHAAIRLRTRRARWLAAIFGGADALIYVLLAIEPDGTHGQAASGAIGTIGGLLALGTLITGCVFVAPLRRMVYDGLVDANDPAQPAIDPAIKAVLAARARRDDARKLVADDPLLAKELHIGRPDLTGDYNDGGLVDLNSAPADVIARICDIPAEIAGAIVEFRDRSGQSFTNADELFVMADLPVSMWDRIRDRAVLLL